VVEADEAVVAGQESVVVVDGCAGGVEAESDGLAAGAGEVVLVKVTPWMSCSWTVCASAWHSK